MTFEYELTILEAHLDTFGHVNNAVYLSLFEQARWEAITPRGFGLATIQESKLGPTILEITIRFQREIKLREKIKIQTKVLDQKGKICTLRQIMMNARGEEACVADFVIGLFDLQKRKLIEPTPEWRFALGLDESK